VARTVRSASLVASASHACTRETGKRRPTAAHATKLRRSRVPSRDVRGRSQFIGEVDGFGYSGAIMWKLLTNRTLVVPHSAENFTTVYALQRANSARPTAIPFVLRLIQNTRVACALVFGGVCAVAFAANGPIGALP
jgi:hypothetical protein